MAKEIIGDHIPNDPNEEFGVPSIAPIPITGTYVSWPVFFIIWLPLLLGGMLTYVLCDQYHTIFRDMPFIQPIGYILYPIVLLTISIFVYRWARSHILAGSMLLTVLAILLWAPTFYVMPALMRFYRDPGEPLINNLRYDYPKAITLLNQNQQAWPANQEQIHPLSYAIQHQQLEAVRLLAPRYVDTQTQFQEYPCISAAKVRNREVLQLLIDLGYQFHDPVPSIQILQLAQVQADYDWIQFLIQIGIDPRTKGFWDKLTSAQQQVWAAGILPAEQRNAIRILQILRRYYSTPALFNRIQTLLQEFTALNLRDYQSFNVVAYSIEYEDLPLLESFVKKGASLQEYAYGQTPPIVFAAEKGNLLIAKYLLQQGVNPDQPNKGGITAAMIAVTSNNLAFLQELRKYNSNIWQRDPLNRQLEDLTTSPSVKLYIQQEKRADGKHL